MSIRLRHHEVTHPCMPSRGLHIETWNISRGSRARVITWTTFTSLPPMPQDILDSLTPDLLSHMYSQGLLTRKRSIVVRIAINGTLSLDV